MVSRAAMMESSEVMSTCTVERVLVLEGISDWTWEIAAVPLDSVRQPMMISYDFGEA